jgi:polysaccharide biosynthesis transport protein
LAGAVVGGLLLGTVISLILRVFDSSLHTVDQVEAYLESPVVSVVPSVNNRPAPASRMLPNGGGGHTLRNKWRRLQAMLVSAAPFSVRKRPDTQPVSGDMVVYAQAQRQVAEAFRKLRTVLRLRETVTKSLLFISAVPNEGKSFCAINYAVSVARLGEPVLLIDTDLLRPAIEEVFLGRGVPRAGLADVLVGTTSLSDAIQKTAIENLFILTAGTRTVDPSKLLFTSAFESCLRAASLLYNQVIIDSAPIHVASDSLLIAKHVDAAYMVIKARKTPRKTVYRAWQLLAETGIAIAGIVLNQVREDSEYSHHPYGYQPAKGDPAHALG